jgi:hypothetical protein
LLGKEKEEKEDYTDHMEILFLHSLVEMQIQIYIYGDVWHYTPLSAVLLTLPPEHRIEIPVEFTYVNR